MFHVRSSTFDRVQKASTEYYETQRRYNYVTPKSYLELIGFYKFLLDQKRTEVQRQIDRLDVGLSTLRKTAADVAELQVDLTHTMVKVQQDTLVIRFRLHRYVSPSLFIVKEKIRVLEGEVIKLCVEPPRRYSAA